MKWAIWYKHTFGGDKIEGTYEEAKAFGIQSVKEELEERGIVLPVTVDNCGKKEVCNIYEDFIEEIEEWDYVEDEEDQICANCTNLFFVHFYYLTSAAVRGIMKV